MAEKINIKITALAHDGRGIGFLPSSGGRGKAVFVPGALPDQDAVCAVQKDRGAWLEATLCEIADSAWQPQPVCPHWHECGGCPLLPMPYPLQLQWKERLARDALLRIGHMDEAAVNGIWEGPLASPQLTGYRNKVELAFGNGKDGLVLGFRKRQSHAVFSLEECRILPEGALPLVQAAASLADKSGLPAYGSGSGKKGTRGFWRFLTLRKTVQTATGKPTFTAICLTSAGSAGERKNVRDFGVALLEACPQLAFFIHEERGARDMLARGKRRICCLDRSGRENAQAATVAMSLGGRIFRLDAASFFQINNGSAELLAKLALRLDAMGASPQTDGLLDLYCGVGAPGQLLAPRHSQVFGMELDKRAIQFAISNAQLAGLKGARYMAGDATTDLMKQIAKASGQFGTVLADPPRGGLAPSVLAAIKRLAPERIIYISCNPATFARDAASLREDYECAFLGGVDMFPHTPHLECVGLWDRRQL